MSYATLDFGVAKLIVERLRDADIGCWIAPEMQAGSVWAQEVVAAIRAAKIFLMVNRSPQTRREIVLADGEKLEFLAVRLADFQPWSHLRYFLCDRQWIDASQDGVHTRLGAILEAVRFCLRKKASDIEDDIEPAPAGLVLGADLGVHREEPDLDLHLPNPLAGKVHSTKPSPPRE